MNKKNIKLVLFATAGLFSAASWSAQAANTSHTLTTTGASNVSTATWTGGAPTNLTIGDIIIYNTAATAATTTVDVNVSIGVIRNNNTGVLTIASGAGVLTLDGTGLTSGNSPFANAGVASLANTSTTAGGLTVNSALVLANTDLDIGTTNTGSIVIGGNITASTAQNLNFRANFTGAITDSAAIGGSGSNIIISNLGTNTGLTTLSGALGSSVASVTQNSATSALTLSGANGSFTGPVNLTAGTLNIGSATALGTGTLTIAAGTTLNSSGGAQTLTTNNLQQWNGSFTFTGTNNITFGTGAITLGTNVAVTVNGQSLFENGAIGDSGSGYGLTKLGGLNLFLQGANTYTGPTTVGAAGSLTNGGTLGVLGASGSINTSSGYTINGAGSKILLDNTAGNVDRLKNTGAVNLNLGGELSLTGNAATDTTETIGSLALGTGSGIVTVTSAAGRVTTLAASGLSRTNNSTGLVRGTSLNQSAATNVSRITLGTAPSGADFVGTNTLTGGATNDATQALKIVPWLIGDTAVGNSGNNFVTYDSTLGLRVLLATEQTTLTTGYTTAANHDNAIAGTNITLTNASGIAVNSLLFNATSALNSATSNALTVDSGAVALVTNNVASIGSGFSGLTLGNGEGVITATQGTLTINTPVSVTSSGGLTKTGAGTVVLAASNLYTGQTTVNQGTLQVGTGTAGDLGSNTANIVLNGGTLFFGRTNSGLTLANNISGAGAVTQNGAGGTTVLSGTNTYAGATTISNGRLQFNNAASMSSNSALTLNNTGTTDTGAISLALRSNTSAAFTLGAAGNINLVGNGTTGATVFYNIDVNNLTSGSGNTLTLGSTVNATNGNTNGIAQINVTGGNGYTLALGNYNQSSNNGNGASQFNVASGVTLTLARIIGAAQSSDAFFSGAGNTSILGAIGKDANTGRTLNLNFNQTGTVTLNAAYGAGVSDTPRFNSGTVVYNNAAATSNSVLNIGTVTNAAANANNVNVLLGGGTGGLTGGLTYTGAIVAEDGGASFLNTGTLSVGGQNTSGTNTFNNTVKLGATTNVGRSLNLVAATGGQVDFTNVISNNGTDTTAGITINSPIVINAVTTNPSGTVRLAGANTYRGTTTIAGGTLLVDSANALNTNALGGNITFTGGVLQYGSTATTDYSSRIKNSTSAIAIDTNTLSRTYASALDSSNTAGLTKNGTGTLALSAANAYTGTTTVGGGTLQASGAGTFGNVNNNLTVNTGGTVDLNNTSQGVGALNGTGGTIVNNSTLTATTLTVGNNNATGGSYAGVIADHTSGTGTVGLTKTGTGTQTLTGANTYTGATHINAGTLLVSSAGSLGSTAVDVVASATLNNNGTIAGAVDAFGTVKGSGTFNGAVTFESGSNNSPGNSPGLQAYTSGVSYLTGSSFNFELTSNTTSGRGLNFDAVDVTGGTLTIQSGVTFNLAMNVGSTVDYSSAFWTSNQSWLVFSDTNSPSTTAGIFTLGSISNDSLGASFATTGGSFSFSQAGPNNILLNYTAVPEPSTYALLGMGLASLWILRRKKKA